MENEVMVPLKVNEKEARLLVQALERGVEGDLDGWRHLGVRIPVRDTGTTYAYQAGVMHQWSKSLKSRTGSIHVWESVMWSIIDALYVLVHERIEEGQNTKAHVRLLEKLCGFCGGTLKDYEKGELFKE